MSQSRIRPAAALVLVSGAIPGCTSGRLLPAVITVPHAYVGFTTSVRVSFTLNGAPVTPMAVAVPLSSPEFGAELSSPLDPTPSVSVTPTKPGPLSGTMVVLVGGTYTNVGLSAVAVAPPVCPAVDSRCGSSTFDPNVGQCVTHQRPDGTSCGATGCVAQPQCHNGACVSTPVPLPAADCFPSTAIPTSITSAWQYATANSPVAGSGGVFDAAGNQYFAECADGWSSCEAVAVNIEGIESWRVPVQIASTVNDACFPGSPPSMLVGDTYVLPASDATGCILQGLSVTDGSLLWSYSTGGASALAAAGPDGPLAVLELGSDATFPTQLVLLDPQSGNPVGPVERRPRRTSSPRPSSGMGRVICGRSRKPPLMRAPRPWRDTIWRHRRPSRRRYPN